MACSTAFTAFCRGCNYTAFWLVLSRRKSLKVLNFACSVIQQIFTLTFWHRSFTFNSNKSATWCSDFSFNYPDVCYSSTCFGRFPAHHQELNDCSGSLCFYIRIVVTVVLCSWSGRPAGPTTNNSTTHHDTMVKPEAATAVIDLLMMVGKTPETCWAVNKRQDNKLENSCIWLVIYLNCTMMHGLTNLKFYI